MSAYYLFFVWPMLNIEKMHLCKIIFLIFLSNLRVKLPITKTIDNNIFEGMTLICLNIVSKQFKHY